MSDTAPFRLYFPRQETTYRHCDPRTGLIVPDSNQSSMPTPVPTHRTERH